MTHNAYDRMSCHCLQASAELGRIKQGKKMKESNFHKECVLDAFRLIYTETHNLNGLKNIEAS